MSLTPQQILDKIDQIEKEQIQSQWMSWLQVAWYAQQEVEKIHNTPNN